MIFLITMRANPATRPAIALSIQAGTGSDRPVGGGEETGAEVRGGVSLVLVVVVLVVVGATDEAGGLDVEVIEVDIGVVEAGGSDRGEGFEDEVAGDAVRWVSTSSGRFDSDPSVSVFPASPISSLKPSFNSSGTFSPA